MTQQTYAQILADFVVGLSFDDLPDDVVRRAEVCVLDYVGVTLAGASSASGAIVKRYVEATGGSAEATIFGTETRVPVAQAALANGAVAHSVELDDHEAHHRSKVHSGVTVFPAAWAISETRPTTGRDFLTAVVLGYDVIGRLSAATAYPNFLNRQRGYHTTALFGPFSAGATAGRLLGLSRDQLVNTFGILGSMCSGLSETVAAGAMAKCLHAGWASHAGVVAAKLAADGFTGPASVFEGKRGFYRAFCGEGNFDLSVIDAGLGEQFDISLTMYKPYACAGGLHAALTAVDRLRAEHAINPDDVEGVLVRTNQHVVETFVTSTEAKYRPNSGQQGQFSLPYAVATLLVDGTALMAQFTDVAVQRPNVIELAQRVRAEVDADLPVASDDDEPAAVSIRLKSGRTVTTTVPGGKGSLAVPMTEDELTTKFRSLSEPTIGADRATDLQDRILRLASDPDVGDIPRGLRREASD